YMSVPSEFRIVLRQALPEDEEFFFKVYAGTREEEIASWGMDPVQKQAFLNMQFRAQQFSFEEIDDRGKSVIMVDNKAVGRLVVDRTQNYLHLVDIALLPEYRNYGIGTQLLKDLQAEAETTGLPFVLEVLKNNRAGSLYKRMGFEITGDTESQYQMQWE